MLNDQTKLIIRSYKGNIFRFKSRYFFIIATYSCISIITYLFYADFRYAKYAMPLFILIVFPDILNNKSLQKFQNRIFDLKNFILYATAISMINSLEHPLYLEQYFRELIFIISPVLVVVIISKLSKVADFKDISVYALDVYTYFTIVVFVIDILSRLSSGFSFSLKDLIINSDSPFESASAFVIGMTSITYMNVGKKKLFITTLLLTVLSSKRIVIIATCLCILLNLLMKEKNGRSFSLSRRFITAIILINLLLLSLQIAFSDGTFNVLIDKYLGDVNFVTQGRQSLYRHIFDTFGTHIQIFGNGLGSTYQELSYKLGEKGNLHSDVLKLYFETGIIGFTMWLLFIYRFASKSLVGFILTVYLNILYFSDNVFIYIDTMMGYYCLIFIVYLNLNKRVEGRKFIGLVHQK